MHKPWPKLRRAIQMITKYGKKALRWKSSPSSLVEQRNQLESGTGTWRKIYLFGSGSRGLYELGTTIRRFAISTVTINSGTSKAL